MPKCVILGGGGHARVLIDSLASRSEVTIHGILDRDAARHGSRSLGVPVLGGDDLLAGLLADGVDTFAVGVGGTGDNRPRQRLFEQGVGAGLRPLTVVHRDATCSAHATIGAGCQLFARSVVNAGARLGNNVIVNTAAVVEHDCRIGDHVHVATAAALAGAVQIGARGHIGAGAVIRQSILLGDDVVVGAGAVVIRNVPPGRTVVGVPAHALVRSRS